MQRDKKQPIRSPFDISGPSTIGTELEKERTVSEQNRGSEKTRAVWKGWMIGKPDPNQTFLAINQNQIGSPRNRRTIR